MSYTKSENARLGSGSDSEEEILIQTPKGKGKKGEGKGKKTPEKKSYRCDRCNFSSGSKAKYTKHAKSAHSGTIVQCDHCEFKTPYKWNLDRHYKNHLGGGALCCHLCNFSCDIKQSLTVHLQNHHTNVPEEIIESVKRQQIPPRNQSINNPLHNNNISSGGVVPPNTTVSNALLNSDSNSSTGGEMEKKVPPLRISRSLTGLSLGDENNSCSSGGGGGKKEDESTAAVAVSVSPPSPEAGVAAISTGNISSNDSTSSSSDERRNVRRCDRCDFETSGDGNGSSLMKKHLASQHGIHHKTGKHHHHHHHHHKKARTPSSSPERGTHKSPPSPSLLPVVPIPLPPKKSKGSTSPRPGQSASSTSNSPAIHRSQSPLKASEAISAYGSCDHNNLQAVAPSSDEERGHHKSILNLAPSHPHSQLHSSGEESAFTPVLGSDFSSLSSLKKPKHRALAQFYQKIKPKFTADVDSPMTEEQLPAVQTEAGKEEEDGQKSLCSSKSNRCQYCRQRCKSTADLATHLEKCAEAPSVVTKKEGEESGKSCDQGEKKEAGESTVKAGKVKTVASKKEGGDEPSPTVNGTAAAPATEMSDELIGFETAPGVGAIHTGKMDEMEYQGYLKEEAGRNAEEEGEAVESRANEVEEDDEEIDDGGGSVGNKPTGKGGKAVTSRKVYRCPEADCSFWATTASRFHVHIVGHYNLKPFECSECHYKSNWRWDVNKHIRLKTPKDPKHASAKTLLTHESGQRDYRKYDNYLVCMSLTHSANAKAPDCSTVANKRTKGGTVSTPKSSPELQPSPGSTKESPVNSASVANSPSSSAPAATPATTAPAKQRSPKYAKALLAASSPPTSTAPAFEPTPEEITAFEYHPSQNLQQRHQQHPEQQQQPKHHHQEDSHAFPIDLGSSTPAAASTTTAQASSPAEGRTFVETRMHAGGEIYQQTSLLKPEMSSGGVVDGDREGGGDVPPNGFDLTLKRPQSRHAHHPQEEMRNEDVPMMQDVKPAVAAVVMTPPTKKSRLKQIQLQQQQELLQQKQLEQQNSGGDGSGAIGEGGSKSLSMWQCIKCSFQHPNKELVSSHIRDMHKPKKGDTVSLLAHNHLVQVMIPEHEVEGMMTSGTNVESVEYAPRSAAATITPAQKKEIYQQMFHENGKVLSCKYCPYSTGLLYEMEIHADHHLNKSNSYYSCPHCSYSVAVKSELQEHLRLHGGDILPEIQNRLINSSTTISTARLSMPSPTSTTENLSLSNRNDSNSSKNKYHCVECPYATNDPSEFQYHKQCHEPHDYPFKCHRCSFNVSVKFHLLQHLRVHGIQIDEVGIPQQQHQQPASEQYPPEPVYEDVSNDYSPGPQAVQDEPLNLSIFANRKPVVIWENGVPMEGYKCSVCPQVFHDLNDLKEHEYTNNHRATVTNNGTSSNASNYGAATSRNCDSPPCEAMNLSFKPAEHSTNKKSSHSHSKVNNNTSSSGKRSAVLPLTTQIPQQLSTIPLGSPSPSSVHSAELGSSCSSKGEKEYLYLCDECPARFFFEKELKIHHTFHENKSPFQCPKCTYSARQKDPHLMSHMRVHGGAYQEKTKALLVKFPRAKVNLNPASNAAAAAAAAAAALSAASLLNSSILNPNFNFQTAAAAMLSASAGGKFKPDMSAFTYPGDQASLESLRKNGLSIACPKCPEKFYNTQMFQQHYEMHSSNGRADYRCRFCDYCADSRKSLAIHEIVHTGSDLSLEQTGALAGKLLTSPGTAFNPVSMMAMVAHQDSPFTSAVGNVSVGGSNGAGEADNPEKNVIPVPDEAFEGNPDFVYPTYMKNGRVKSKRYKCIKCPSAFEKKDQYHTHIGLHGSNQKYKCTVCDYAVTYYANYIQHLKKHENQRNIPSDLLALGRKRHQVDDEINGSLPKIAKLAENGDASSNSSLESLENHHHHTNGHAHVPSLFKCSFCPFQCYDETSLENHLVHHQDNPNWLHVCNICTFRTSSKKSLKEHARIHLLNTFHLQQQQQQQQQQHHHLLQNGASNGHHNGEYVNGYDNEHHNRQQPPQYEKQQPHSHNRNQYVGEHEDSSNGSL